jgi:hypothetical protein
MKEINWTSEEEKLLRQDALISEMIKRRSEDRPQEESERKVLRFLQSSGGTAVVTILLGSLLAPIVISIVQSRQTRNDQALTEYKQYLQLQQESVKETYDLVGRIVYAAQDLITLTKPTFDLKTLTGQDQVEVEKQKREMLAKYNETIKEWRVKENIQGVLISYYFFSHPQVSQAWRSSEDRVNDFIACAQHIHENFVKNMSITDGDYANCQKKKDAINTTLDRLAQSIEVSRRYTWQQLELPEMSAPSTSSPAANTASPSATVSPTGPPAPSVSP